MWHIRFSKKCVCLLQVGILLQICYNCKCFFNFCLTIVTLQTYLIHVLVSKYEGCSHLSFFLIFSKKFFYFFVSEQNLRSDFYFFTVLSSHHFRRIYSIIKRECKTQNTPSNQNDSLSINKMLHN